MRVPGPQVTDVLQRGGGRWILEVYNPPGETHVASKGWTFPRRCAAQTFARCLQAVNPGTTLDIRIRRL